MAGDEEQVEALKKWWSENGKGLVAGLAIGLAGVVGWTSWQTWQQTQAETASVRYDQIVNHAADGEHEQVLSSADVLIDEYPGSAYASLTALIAARAAVEANDPDRAQKHLQWVVENASFPELVPIARLRLASLMLDAGEYDAALGELARIDSAAFRTRASELEGDVKRATGDRTAARESYERVLAGETLSPSVRVRVRMKLDDLGELTTAPSG